MRRPGLHHSVLVTKKVPIAGIEFEVHIQHIPSPALDKLYMSIHVFVYHAALHIAQSNFPFRLVRACFGVPLEVHLTKDKGLLQLFGKTPPDLAHQVEVADEFIGIIHAYDF
ncbi:MAG: hypothetical protein BWY70_00644 [Bacteroidetes bacterium ADurb.Bin408]|nr:MAG: hypothetical protein BWY70_00644 [Bacteroidetes bacterium ADurb.Bin408]